jgi:hypothetical protein
MPFTRLSFKEKGLNMLRRLCSRIRSPVTRYIFAAKGGLLAFLGFLFLFSRSAFADWTPLITSDDFTGPQADLMTTVGGALIFVLIVMAAGMVINMLRGGR